LQSWRAHARCAGCRPYGTRGEGRIFPRTHVRGYLLPPLRGSIRMRALGAVRGSVSDGPWARVTRIDSDDALGVPCGSVPDEALGAVCGSVPDEALGAAARLGFG
jgi:hypothetical protein